jgi:galactoside O-acetyltransferase
MFSDLLEGSLRLLPGGIGRKIRYAYYRSKYGLLIDCYSGCIIAGCKSIETKGVVSLLNDCKLYATGGGRIILGANIHCNHNVLIDASDKGLIEIGNDVLIGPNVVFRASNHNYNDKNTLIRLQGHTGGRIVIEDDVWIASNVVILPNVRVGKGAVIAAGAVVNKDVPSYSLAGGVPAQIIKTNCRE